MALRKTSTALLSISVLMASTGLAQAGFIWLAPDQATANTSAYSRQAEPPVADGTQVQGRAWATDSAVPLVATQQQSSAMTSAPALSPTPPSANDQSLVAPPGIAAPVMAAPVAEAPAVLTPAVPVVADAVQVVAPDTIQSTAQSAPVLLKNETMSSAPMISAGDQPISAPVAVTAPDVASIAAVAAPMPQSDVTLASTVVTAPTPPAAPSVPEVTLANATMASPAVEQQPNNPGMPTAESIINGMPSMTAPTPAPSTAPVAPVASAPQAVTPPAPPAVEMTSAPVLTPASSLASTEPLVPPPGVSAVPAPAPVAQATGEAISLITGEAVQTAAAPAPVAPTDKVIDGFGKQVPLIIAMRQIIPSDYGFAHRDGVDLGQLVDWQGGRAWPQVLNDALAPIGVKATLNGDTVLLEKTTLAAAAPVSAAPEAPRAQLTNTTVIQPTVGGNN